MAKTKMVDGVLCKDKQEVSAKTLVFFPGLHRGDVGLGIGGLLDFWDKKPGSPGSRWKAWTPEKFTEKYDLRDSNNKPCKPPRAGTAFEVELEL